MAKQGKIEATQITAATPVSVTSGGTGSTTASGALTSLGAQPANTRLSAIANAATPTATRNIQIDNTGAIVLGDPGSGGLGIGDDRFVEITEHFLGTATSGSFGLINANTGTGAASTAIDGFQSNIGVIQLSTGTTATGTSTLRTHNGSFLFGNCAISLRQVARIPVLADSANNFSVRLGFSSSTNAVLPLNGAHFTYDLSSPNWWVRTFAGGSTNTTGIDTGIAVTTDWTTLDTVINKAGTQAQFFINNVLAGTITTNIPTVTGQEVGVMQGILKTAGTTARTLQVDYLRLRMDFR